MLTRFVLYSVFKNLRFFEAFFILYLLAPVSQGGAALSFFHVGILTGYQKLLTALLEVPSGFVADSWGRRRSVMVCFGCYSLAFPLYALGAELESGRLVLLVVAQSLFGIGEAFRTGTHKAIMLDWVDQTPDAPEAVQVIGNTRFWSKSAAGFSAVVGGLLLWQTKTFTWLFLGATVPALLGVLLLFTYPTWLDGEYVRRRERSRLSWGARLRNLRGLPGMMVLLLQSILFESHIKIAQHYIQPLLQNGIEAKNAVVVGGVGAMVVGFYYLVQDSVGAVASRVSGAVANALGPRSLTILQGLSPAAIGMISYALAHNLTVAALSGLLTLAVLQNLRRPIFVTRLNEVMDKSQRAATLSIESQSRSLGYAVLAPLTGWVVDHYGIAWGLGVLALTSLSVFIPRKEKVLPA